MSLRIKTLILLGLAFLLSLTALYFTAQVVIEQSIAGFEVGTARTDVQRVREALANDTDAFAVLLRDWSVWDDTYAFVQDGNMDYVASNLTAQELQSLELNAVVLLDNDGKIVYGTGFDLQTDRFTHVPAGLASYLAPGSLLITHPMPSSAQVGLIRLPGGVMLIGSRPIVDSLESKPPRGTLIFGRYFDAEQVSKLARTTHLHLELVPWDAVRADPVLNDVRGHLPDSESVFSQPLDSRTLVVFARIDDLTSNPIFLAEISTERTAYAIAQSGLRYFLVSLLIIGVIGIVTVLLLAERMVLRPVAELSRQVKEIGEKRDAGVRVTIQAEAELASLGTNINAMLNALAESRSALDKERARYQAIVEGQKEWIIRFSPDGQLTFVNEAFCRAMHMTGQALMGANWLQLMPEVTRREAEHSLHGLSPAAPEGAIEMRVPNRDGTLTWQSWTWHAILDPAGQITEVQGVGNDVTERVRAEEQWHYLSTHDALTGLYNRAYFEAELERLEQAKGYPISIVVGDIDQLKPLNDQYGHRAGDATLRLAAGILRKSFRTQDILCRIGGDEFAVILPGTDQATALAALQRVKHHIFASKMLAHTPTVDISLGVATAVEGTRLDMVLQRADENMYDSKFATRREIFPDPKFDAGTYPRAAEMQAVVPRQNGRGAEARRYTAEHLRSQYEQLETVSKLLERLNRSDTLGSIYQAGLTTLVESLHADHAGILLLDRTGVMRFCHSHQLAAGYRSSMEEHSPWLRDGQLAEPVEVEDIQANDDPGLLQTLHREHGLASLCLVPLRTPERMLGAMIFHYDSAHVFTSKELQLVHTIANQTGLAIARKQDESARRRAEQWNEVLSTLAQQLSAAESGLEAAQYIAQAADRVLPWDAFLLAMYSPERDLVLQSILAMDLIGGNRTIVTTPDEMEPSPMLRRALDENGLLLLRQEGSAEPRSTMRFGDVSRMSASLMYMPIRHRTQVVGILSIQSYTHDAFDESALDFLRTLAEHCGGALARIHAQDGLNAKTVELERAYDETIEGWSEALDLRDHEIRGHSQRVMTLALELAKRLALPEEQLPHLRRGALLHDIGKMALPDEILFKPGPLTTAEWDRMRRHPQLAYDMLKNIEYLRPALDIPYCHHEHWDGKGYPRGLVGTEIPLAARIFAIVDVWDALRSDRPYRSAWTPAAVREYLQQQANKQFDPAIVQAFLEMLDSM